MDREPFYGPRPASAILADMRVLVAEFTDCAGSSDDTRSALTHVEAALKALDRHLSTVRATAAPPIVLRKR